MRSDFSILAASALFAAGVMAMPHAGHTAPPPGEARNGAVTGAAIFTAQGCYLCHGRVGQGARGVGATLVPLRLDDAAFGAYVRAPTGSMPVYSRTVLTDADLVAVAAYLRSIPAPRPASEIALLANDVVPARSVRPSPVGGDAHPATTATATTAAASDGGKADYIQNCSGCHGADRQGGAGPSLLSEGQTRGSAGVAQLIMAPPPGMPKLYPQPLTAAQVEAIAQYVASR